MQFEKNYDVLAMGRSSIDLYSNDIGATFSEINSFAAMLAAVPPTSAWGRGAWVYGWRCLLRLGRIQWEISFSLFWRRKMWTRASFPASQDGAPAQSSWVLSLPTDFRWCTIAITAPTLS